jgi:hypothetical protein
MCHQLGCPGAFLSASAADVQWPGLGDVYRAAGFDADTLDEDARAKWQNKCLIADPAVRRKLAA